MSKLGGAFAAIAVAGLLAAAAVTPSDAARKHSPVRQSIYDGMWSVSIYTQYGPCDPSYRYPARIARGRVEQVENDFSYQLTGVVTSAGGISVTVSKSGQSATGYGRLTRTGGAGWWRAAGGQCSGRWTAVRRG
jgi:hypothetical protein